MSNRSAGNRYSRARSGSLSCSGQWVIGSDSLPICRQPRGKWEMRTKALSRSSRGLNPTLQATAVAAFRQTSRQRVQPKGRSGRGGKNISEDEARSRGIREEKRNVCTVDKGVAVCRDGRKKLRSKREKRWSGNAGIRTDHLDEKRNKGKERRAGRGRDEFKESYEERADSRGKAIREYRRKKQQRRGGRESNRKIEIPSAGRALAGIFRAVTRFHKANWLSRIVSSPEMNISERRKSVVDFCGCNLLCCMLIIAR